SRKGIGDFPLTSRIQGYWDRSDTEIDLVALNETARVIRVGSCKRSANELLGDIPIFDGHVQRFLAQFPTYSSWRVERVCLAPRIPPDIRQSIESRGYVAQDLIDLTGGF